MMDVDFGKDFNQREYWVYDIKVKMAILKVLQEIRERIGYGNESPLEEDHKDYHSTIAEQLNYPGR
jgi:hypothetical protein